MLAGRATFTATTAAGPQTLDVEPGDVLHVPAGTGHSAEVHEALEIVFLLPANCTTTWSSEAGATPALTGLGCYRVRSGCDLAARPAGRLRAFGVAGSVGGSLDAAEALR